MTTYNAYVNVTHCSVTGISRRPDNQTTQHFIDTLSKFHAQAFEEEEDDEPTEALDGVRKRKLDGTPGIKGRRTRRPRKRARLSGLEATEPDNAIESPRPKLTLGAVTIQLDLPGVDELYDGASVLPVTIEKLSIYHKTTSPTRDHRHERSITPTRPTEQLDLEFEAEISTGDCAKVLGLRGDYKEKEIDTHRVLRDISESVRRSKKGKLHLVGVEGVLLFPASMYPGCYLQLKLTWELDRSGTSAHSRADDSLWELSCLERYVHLEASEPVSAPASTHSAASRPKGAKTWSPEDFYKSVHVTSSKDEIPPQIQSKTLESDLYPFQRRAVKWLLRREGVIFEDGGHLVDVQSHYSSDNLPPSFFKAYTKRRPEEAVYVSQEKIMATLDPSVCEGNQDLRGGILAEEMGLGKSVELLALIALHKRDGSGKHWDNYTASEVTRSGATLIVAPPSLMQQWELEINKHAPSLRVHQFTGTPSSMASQARHEVASPEYLLQFDIVLTTYNVLKRELHFARPPPERNTRSGGAQETRRRSPLVEIEWWRVCLDEAQMVESGVSNHAQVARLIPRIHAWAISGTPLRKNIQDLRGLLAFLRYEPYWHNEKMFSSINKWTFQELFGRIALRHTKAGVRHELALPPQKRVVITVPFTPIEEQNYTNLFAEMCGEVQLTAEGNPAVDDWDPKDYVEKMRMYLTRLRQTCLHPQVGGRNRRALGRKNVPLRTVADVLDVMIEQNDTKLRGEECDYVTTTLTRGHIYAYAKDIHQRARKALEIYQVALEQSTKFVEECRRDLADEIAKAKLRSKPERETDEEDSQDEDGKGKENAEKDDRVGALRTTLRRSLETQHACLFYAGTAYFQLKSNETEVMPESEEFYTLEKMEIEFYDKAKEVRKELLQENRTKAESSMRRLKKKVKAQELVALQTLQEIDDEGGIENRKVLELMDQFMDILNEQGNQLSKWRTKVVDTLLLPLVDTDEREITGDEYEDSTKQQDELFIYVTALRTIQADRHLALTGQENFRVDVDVKTAIAQAKVGEGHAPELLLELMRKRTELKIKPTDPSLRAIIHELRQLETKVQWDADSGRPRAAVELRIIKHQMKRLQDIQNSEMKMLAALESENNQYHKTMNQRAAFYKQLQQISDTVAPYKEEMDEHLDHKALQEQEDKEKKLSERLETLRTRRRFLQHLKHESNTADGPRTCNICTDPIEIGSLTSCGHVFCKDCLREWYRSHRTCPQCRKLLTIRDFQDITYRPQDLQAKQEDLGQLDSTETAETSFNSTPTSNLSSLYSEISGTTMQEIKAIDLDGSYGTKIDTISRHVLWLRQNDPGSKCIIFSQYTDFLGVLGEAFSKFKIGHSSIMAKDGINKFKNDPSVECFLLDAKSNASGLNLTNATHVFLAEPMINSALELQAIARVHRIGQQRETAVYMYLVSETVEEAIYDISVNRRIQHMGFGSANNSRMASRAVTPGAFQEKAVDDANNREIERAPTSTLLDKKKGRGEFVVEDDLWTCLFSQPPRKPISQELQRTLDSHLRAEAAQQRVQGSDDPDEGR